MSNREELKELVKKVIKANTGLDEISDDADFNQDLKIDSITKMELLMSFEEEFGISIKDEDAMKLTSVNKTIDLIEECRSKVS